MQEKEKSASNELKSGIPKISCTNKIKMMKPKKKKLTIFDDTEELNFYDLILDD